MLLVRLVLVGVFCCVGSAIAAAGSSTVALLPLDAPGKLAIYGQPVASEVARTLTAAGLEVVVVGAQMAVPRDAVLVVEGSIASARRRVTVELRLRTLDSRVALATVAASEASLATLDRAASSVASQLLPQVREQLSRRLPPPSAEPPVKAAAVAAAPPPASEPPPPPALIVVQTSGSSADFAPAFRDHLVVAAGALAEPFWSSQQVTLPEINPAVMIGAISTSPGALGLAFDVRKLAVEQSSIFVGKVEVRVILTFVGKVIFDRTLVTDSIIGGRKATRDAMLQLMAGEVVAIMRPRLRDLLAEVMPRRAAPLATGPAAEGARARPTAGVPARAER